MSKRAKEQTEHEEIQGRGGVNKQEVKELWEKQIKSI